MMDNRRIAHELANQLTVIRGSAELVNSRIAPHDPTAHDVRAIVDAADASILLVKELSASCYRRQRWPKWWARGRA